MKLLCILAVVSCVITSRTIKTDDIMQMLKRDKTKYDPEGKRCYIITNSTTTYINQNQQALLYKIQKEAKENNKFEYVLVVVDSIPDLTSNPAHEFASNLQTSMINGGYITSGNSIIIIFAMVDHKSNIETDTYSRAKFSDSRVAKYLDLIKNDLVNKNYYKAFSTLLGYFRDNYYPPTPSSGEEDSKLTTLILIGGLVVIVVGFALISLCNRFCPSSSSSSNTDSATYDYPNAPLYSDNYNTGLVNTNPQPVIHVHHHSPPKHHHHPPPHHHHHHHHHSPPHHHHHSPPKPKPKPAPKTKGAKPHGSGASGGW